MNIWAIVPVKPFNRAKSRLATDLLPDQRERLASALFVRTVKLLVAQSNIQGVLVVSRDTKALSMARDMGAQTVQESGNPELNSALYRATQVSRMWGAEATLVVPADIPLLHEDDIAAMLNLGQYHNSVVIAPDRHEHGTNMLLVHPPGLIPYSFGHASFATHQQLAQQNNANVSLYRSARVSLDIDTPTDLIEYAELAKLLEEPMIEALEEWPVTRESTLTP
ncbi:MAG TPA: 2-phospho-L-lactate guanylyltransferase [Aggregatilineaceae bacterium]|nr:2-phospho-L-lactate guanylyltransferase [Aggregatilineaceae bacterium]